MAKAKRRRKPRKGREFYEFHATAAGRYEVGKILDAPAGLSPEEVQQIGETMFKGVPYTDYEIDGDYFSPDHFTLESVEMGIPDYVVERDAELEFDYSEAENLIDDMFVELDRLQAEKNLAGADMAVVMRRMLRRNHRSPEGLEEFFAGIQPIEPSPPPVPVEPEPEQECEAPTPDKPVEMGSYSLGHLVDADAAQSVSQLLGAKLEGVSSGEIVWETLGEFEDGATFRLSAVYDPETGMRLRAELDRRGDVTVLPPEACNQDDVLGRYESAFEQNDDPRGLVYTAVLHTADDVPF